MSEFLDGPSISTGGPCICCRQPEGSQCWCHETKREIARLRLAMGVEDHETVDSSGHGWVRVESPGGDLRRISPIDERVIELEQENERLRKDAERLLNVLESAPTGGLYAEIWATNENHYTYSQTQTAEWLKQRSAAIDAAKEAK